MHIACEVDIIPSIKKKMATLCLKVIRSDLRGLAALQATKQWNHIFRGNNKISRKTKNLCFFKAQMWTHEGAVKHWISA